MHPPIQDISPVLAVVDVGRVRKGYPRARKLEEILMAERDQIELALRKRKEEVDKMGLELQGWKPFTPEWIDARGKVEAAAAELKSRQEMEKRRWLINRLENRQLVYDDIDRAVQELAKKRKLQLVLKMLPDVPDTEPLDQRVAMWATKIVFYYDDKLDLTEDVIKSLKSPAFAGGVPVNAPDGKDGR